MSAFRWHCIKLMPNGDILRAGPSYETYVEAQTVAEHKLDEDPEEDGEIWVVDDLELAALGVGKRCVNAPL